MNALKIILICLAVSGPVAFGAYQYGRSVDSSSVDGGLREADRHGENGHEAHEAGTGSHEAEHEDHDGAGDSRQAGTPVKGHWEVDTVSLTGGQIAAMGIAVSKAGSGTIETIVTLPGEIILNDDAQALVTPYVSGHVKEIRKRQGDPVKAGDVLAVLESRELADTASVYLANRERLLLAEKNFQREESLWKKKISPETDYLEAKMTLSAARIALRATRQKLMAMGLQKTAIRALSGRGDRALTRYEIVSPLDGQVLEKNLTLGEMVESATAVYRVAGMKTVWVEISLLQKHLSHFKEGMSVRVWSSHPEQTGEGTVTYIGPLVGRDTRTATARALLPNPDGRWRPGLFVSVRMAAGEKLLPMVVPKGSVQRIDGETALFVPGKNGFEARRVTTGQSDENFIEIVSGLSKGDDYVSAGAFELKAALETDSLGSHAGHGH